MEIRTKIFKAKSGQKAGSWIARVSFTDMNDRARTIERRAAKRSDAKTVLDQLVESVKKTHGGIADGTRMTFSDLVRKVGSVKYRKAVIVEGRKMRGVRSHKSAQASLTVLELYFGKMPLDRINSDTLHSYHEWRLKLGSRRPEVVKAGEFKPVKLATVNGELSTMRALMKDAVRRGLIQRDPFVGAKVIVRSAESARNRRLSYAEEDRLLDACTSSTEYEAERVRNGKVDILRGVHTIDRKDMRAVILLAVDTGMRKGEILKLRWKDIDFIEDTITVIATHTKTEKPRVVPLSERAKAALAAVYQDQAAERVPQGTDRPFPFSDFKRVWLSLKKKAGIEDLHFHDLRSTAITRWLEMGHAPAQASKMAGHSDPATTLKYYTIADEITAKAFADSINAANAARAMAEAAELDGPVN